MHETEDRGRMTEVRAASDRNLWLIKKADRYKFQKPLSDKDLHGFTPGWGRYSIFVENVRQIGPVFFKTKPILRQGKIQVSSVLTRDYEEKARFASEPKQSQTKPISGRANVKMGKIFWAG